MQIKNIHLLFCAFALLIALSPSMVYAYITPGEFLGEDPVTDETSPIPTLVPEEGSDIVIPELVPGENTSGTRDDARAGLIQGNGNRRPSNFNTQNLPSNVTRDTRIPGRSIKNVLPEPPVRPTRRTIQETSQPEERLHGAAQNLPPSGLPLALPAILTLICTGGGLYAYRKVNSVSA